MILCTPRKFKNYNYLQHPYYISYRRNIESTQLSYQILTFFEILQYELQGSHPHSNKRIHSQYCSSEMVSAFKELTIDDKLFFMNKIAEGLTKSNYSKNSNSSQTTRIVCKQKKTFFGFPKYQTIILQMKGNSSLILERSVQTTLDLRKYLAKSGNDQITLIEVSKKSQSLTFKFDSPFQQKLIYGKIYQAILNHYVDLMSTKGSEIKSFQSLHSESKVRILTSSNLARFNQKKKKNQDIFKDKEIHYILMAKNHDYKLLVNEKNKAQFKAVAQIGGISSNYLLDYQKRFKLLASNKNLERQEHYQLNSVEIKIGNFQIQQTVLKECVKNRFGFSIFQQSVNFSQQFQCLSQFIQIQVQKNILTIYALFNTRFSNYLQLALNYLSQLCKALLENQKGLIVYQDQYEDYITIIGQQDNQQSLISSFQANNKQLPQTRASPILSTSSSQIDKKSLDNLEKQNTIMSTKRLRTIPQKIVTTNKIEMKDHRVFSEWKRKKGGGLVYYNTTKLQGQSKYIMQMIREYGKKLLEIENFRNFSLHVGLMSKESHLTTMCHSHNYCPVLIQNVAKKQSLQRMKAVVAFQISSGLMGTSFAKPFNPIIGETYQAWIDGCPYYSEQISHHPPIVSFYLLGRGFKFYGQVQPEAKLNMNGILAFNKRLSHFQFDDGDIISFSFGFFTIRGLAWGDRQIQYYEPTFIYNKRNRLFAKTEHGPRSTSFFSSSNDREDYFHGCIYKVSDDFCKKLEISISKLEVIFPTKADIIETLSTFEGEWNSHVNIDGVTVLNFTQNLPSVILEEHNPLPSNSWFRQDLVSLCENQIDQAEKNKKKLQQKQRADQRLRENHNRINKIK